jgi:RecB family exonuclease
MLVISWSKIKRWRRCKKSYDYRYNQRLAKKRKFVRLFKGDLIHEMLSSQTLLKLHPKAPRDTPEDILRKASKKYRVMLKEEREMYGDIIGDVRRVFESYNRHYTEDKLTALSSEEWVSTMIANEVQFMGYIDNRVVDKHDRKWIRDYKSCATIPKEEARFSDIQLVLYAWAWNREQRDPDKHVSGVIWDYIRTKPPTIPEVLQKGELTKRKDIDTDHYTYLKTIKDNGLNPKQYKEILEMLEKKKSTSFLRVKYPIPPKPVMDLIIEDLRASALEIEVLGKEVKTRTLSYDCQSCEFFDLCQAEMRGLDAEFVKKVDYEVREESQHEETHEAVVD